MKHSLRKIGSANIKYFRNKKGMTQLDLAMELGKSPNYINGIENGVSFPSVDMLEEIADILDVKPYELLVDRGCPENVMHFDENEFTRNISEMIYSRLKSDISLAVKNAITKNRK